MGCCLAKVGSDDSGKFLFCLPMNCACIFWGILFNYVGSMGLYTVVSQALLSDGEKGWEFWLLELVSSIAIILYLITGIFWLISICKPRASLKSLLIIMFIGNIINAVFYWIDTIAQMAADTFPEENMPIFITNTLMYCILLIGFWMMMTNIKSLLAIRRAGGNGWEGKDKNQIITMKSRPVPGQIV